MKHSQKRIREAAARLELSKWAADVKLGLLDAIDEHARRIKEIKDQLEKMTKGQA